MIAILVSQSPLFVVSQSPLFLLTVTLYSAAFIAYAATWRSHQPIVGRLATLALGLAIAANSGLIVARWIEAERAPFKSLHESLVFLALCVALVYLVMERLYRTRVFGALASLGSTGALLYALVHWDAEVVRLPPALQSGWFIPHVVVYFVGYGALFFATAVAAVHLVRPTLRLRAGTIFGSEVDLERVTYDAIAFGFVLLTIGLLVGSVWAKEAWGDYWVWDPKENWSLVSWLVYGSYLHLRRLKGWRGRRLSWLAIGGFAVVLFTYLGIELLPTAAESAHAYQ